MSNAVKYVSSLGWTWVPVLWVYVFTGWRCWRWRRQLRLHPERLRESIDSGMKQTLLFIRHGETGWNVEHRLPGQLPGISLNEKGIQQVKQLAEALAAIPVSAIISSPLERACETAQILAEGRDLRIHTEPALADTEVGVWAGKTIEEVSKNDPAWKAFVRNPTVAPEGVETFTALQERAVAAVERWRTTENIGAYPAFVAHADVIKVLLAHYLPLEVSRAPSLMIENASVSLVELEPDHQPRVIAVSWSPRPGWLKPPIPEPQNQKSEEAQAEEAEMKEEEQKE
jgi:probable phosphoglycerate mutase